jgi:hypothetical protein
MFPGLKAEAHFAFFDPEHDDLDQSLKAITPADYNRFLAFPCQNQHDWTPFS